MFSAPQSQSHLEPIQDKTGQIDLSLGTSEGGEEEWSHKYDVAETQQTQCPSGLHVSVIQLSPSLGKAEITIFGSLPFSSIQT